MDDLFGVAVVERTAAPPINLSHLAQLMLDGQFWTPRALATALHLEGHEGRIAEAVKHLARLPAIQYVERGVHDTDPCWRLHFKKAYTA